MSATDRTVDYVILGAGIGGMTLQHILKGPSTVLIDPAPGRYKIGESIIPQHFIEPEVRPLFDIVSRLPSSTPKEGSLFVSHDSVGAFPPFSESNFTIHVARQELEAATAKFFGTEVVREHVEAVDVAARTVETDQGTFVARKLIIDCSGPSRIVARALGLAREVWPVWASWAYHDVVDRAARRDRMPKTTNAVIATDKKDRSASAYGFSVFGYPPRNHAVGFARAPLLQRLLHRGR